jgi:hypothetical protein
MAMTTTTSSGMKLNRFFIGVWSLRIAGVTAGATTGSVCAPASRPPYCGQRADSQPAGGSACAARPQSVDVAVPEDAR